MAATSNVSMSFLRPVGARTSVPGSSDTAARAETAWADRDMGALYRLHVADVARWVRRLGGASIGLEDAVHDVFLVAMRRLDDFDPQRAAFGTWLYAITSKVVYATLRKERWRARILRAFPWYMAGDPQEDEPDLSQAGKTLYMLLDRVAERYRTPFVLFELEGMSCSEIATLTGTSINNVYVRIHRGRQKLAAEVARHSVEGGRGGGTDV